MDRPVRGEPLRVRAVLQCGLALASVLVFFTNLDNYGFALGGPGASLWVIMFAAGAAIALVVHPYRRLHLLQSPFMAWLLFYFALTTAWALFATNLPEFSQFILHRYRSIVCVLVLALLFDDQRARRWAVVAIAACVVFAAALNVAEFLSLVNLTAGQERIPGRSSGFYTNPNGSALAITMGIALVTEEIPKRWRIPLLLVGIMGVLTTFSRGAMVCLALAFLLLAWRKALGTWYVLLGCLCGVLLISYALDFAATHDVLNDNTATRLRLAHDDSGRIELALKAWNMFLTSPIVGHGLGATQTWDTGQYAHNMFLTLAAEQGILGLLAFPAIGVALVGSNRAATCFVAVLMAAGLFSHDLLDSRSILLLVALAAAPRAPVPTPERYALLSLSMRSPVAAEGHERL